MERVRTTDTTRFNKTANNKGCSFCCSFMIPTSRVYIRIFNKTAKVPSQIKNFFAHHTNKGKYCDRSRNNKPFIEIFVNQYCERIFKNSMRDSNVHMILLLVVHEKREYRIGKMKKLVRINLLI